MLEGGTASPSVGTEAGATARRMGLAVAVAVVVAVVAGLALGLVVALDMGAGLAGTDASSFGTAVVVGAVGEFGTA